MEFGVEKVKKIEDNLSKSEKKLKGNGKIILLNLGLHFICIRKKSWLKFAKKKKTAL